MSLLLLRLDGIRRVLCFSESMDGLLRERSCVRARSRGRFFDLFACLPAHHSPCARHYIYSFVYNNNLVRTYIVHRTDHIQSPERHPWRARVSSVSHATVRGIPALSLLLLLALFYCTDESGCESESCSCLRPWGNTFTTGKGNHSRRRSKPSTLGCWYRD